MRRSFTWVSLLAVAATPASQANTPPPPPQKLAENFGFTCRMLAEHDHATRLSVSIRYEPLSAETSSFSRKAYWWTLSGDDARFPSNWTFMNMRSVETEIPQSILGFDAADGWSYTYTLHYAVAERYPNFFFTPDHLVVRRKRTDDRASPTQLVAIGECRLDRIGTEQ